MKLPTAEDIRRGYDQLVDKAPSYSKEIAMNSIDDTASAFEALLPRHAASLTICHNDHKGVYETVAQTVEDDEREPRTSRYTWRDDAEKQEAIATNEMWYCQWYPDTPVGFNCVAAPTLAKLLAFLARQGGRA